MWKNFKSFNVYSLEKWGSQEKKGWEPLNY